MDVTRTASWFSLAYAVATALINIELANRSGITSSYLNSNFDSRMGVLMKRERIQTRSHEYMIITSVYDAVSGNWLGQFIGVRP